MNARDYKKLADDCLKQKNYGEAIIIYTKALELSKNVNLQAHWLDKRASAKRHQGNFHSALEDEDLAIALDSKPHLYWNRGLIYKCMNNWKKAIEDFSVAIALYHPSLDKVDGYLERAVMYEKDNNIELAKSDVEIASKLILENKVQNIKHYSLFLNHDFPEHYAKIKTAFTNRCRLETCLQGEVPITLTDRINKHSELMNKPVLLTCCGSTTDKEGEQPGLDNPLQNIEVEGQPVNINAMNNFSSSQNVSENGLFARSIPSKDNPFKHPSVSNGTPRMA